MQAVYDSTLAVGLEIVYLMLGILLTQLIEIFLKGAITIYIGLALAKQI
jgi:hypothetical protein